MSDNLRFNVADQRLAYTGEKKEFSFNESRIIEFNHRHLTSLANYDLQLKRCNIVTLADKINNKSNLGALRNRQLRQSVILSAAFSAIAVGLHGRGAYNNYSEAEQTKDLANQLKRANDRTAAQIMAEVLQTTTEKLPLGEDVIIESAITEGARMKPGKEAGGNPTIAVGAVYGKPEHCAQYGLNMPKNVSLLSMGNDVIDGTTKSIKGLHSSFTALFVTESNIKRHLPDIYVQRWMSGTYFEKFNPRDISSTDAAEIIAQSYKMKNVNELSAFFLDRPRHIPAMDELNKAGVSTPFDKDGDLMPGLLMGLEGLKFPDGKGLHSMIGEIGGSAEWAVGVLPLVWRGGQALGMLTSQSSLTQKGFSPDELWKERFHFTEEEFLQIQDARFERKPYFTIEDILEKPFAGGISAFGAITDNYYLPFIKGVTADFEKNEVNVDVLTINSLGVVQVWHFTFMGKSNLKDSVNKMTSPKEKLEKLQGADLEREIGKFIDGETTNRQYQLFFNNEYYPALIPVRHQMYVLHQAVDGLIERGALQPIDKEIIAITEKLAPEWFAS
ncbi:MAG: fructose-bisphosphatase class II [Calditrichaeota bacterium]|nr:MAG: fructose-bisphosphatase class II [Calditrichota bacterium]